MLRDLPRPLRRASVAAATDRTMVVAGYAGADVDLFPTLRNAIAAARRCFWLEGLYDQDPHEDAAAAYLRWRFRIDTPPLALTLSVLAELPDRGVAPAVVWQGSRCRHPLAGRCLLAGQPAGPAAPCTVDPARGKGLRDFVRSLPFATRHALSGEIRSKIGHRYRAAWDSLLVAVTDPSRLCRMARRIGRLTVGRRPRLAAAAKAVKGRRFPWPRRPRLGAERVSG